MEYASVSPDTDSDPKFGNTKMVTITPTTGEVDKADNKPQPLRVWCLQISIFDEETGERPSGLVLTRAQDGLFSRVALFSFLPFLREDPQGYDNPEPAFFTTLREEQQACFVGHDPGMITIA
jgi:hypothetical protein